MMKPRVTVLYNEPTLPPDHPDAESEYDILFTADIVAKILGDAGLVVSRLGVTDQVEALLSGLKSQAPDVVFNLYEGTAQWGNTEAFVAGILELLRIPFTGSPTQPIMIARSKPMTKQLLHGAGLPTARFFAVDALPVPPCELPWPVIVKPGREDASIGIDQNSVVTSQADLDERVAYVLKTYGPPVLIEQFIRGREFNVAVWDRTGTNPQPLPYSEILFLEDDGDHAFWPIVSFDAKWHPQSRDFKATPAKNPPEPMSEQLNSDLARVAIQAYELLGCRDYARIDFRTDEAGRTYILEVNPNPCISPLAGLAAGLETAEIPYAEFIVSLVASALKRGTNPALAEFHTTDSELPVVESVVAPVVKRGWKVRAAITDDIDDLIDLLNLAEGFNSAEKVAHAEQLRSLRRRKNWNQWTVLVLAGRSRIGGFALVGPVHPAQGTSTLEVLFVDPSLRRSGLGRLLLSAAEMVVATSGARFMLAAMSSGMQCSPARRFLHACGYAAAGEVPEFYKDGTTRLAFAKPLPVPASSEAASVPAGTSL